MTPKSLPRKRLPLLQWNLSTLLLLTAAVAVWVGCLRYRQVIADLDRQIEVMQKLAPGSIGKGNGQQVLVHMIPDYWQDRRAWNAYLPKGEYAVRIATHDITESGLAPIAAESLVHSGWHRVELAADDFQQRYLVLVDGRQAIHVHEEPDRLPRDGFVNEVCGGSSEVDEPFVLVRKIFRMPHENRGHANGVLFWIERVDETASKENSEYPTAQ